MSQPVNTVNITVSYTDATSHTYAFNNVKADALTGVKDKVKAINANMSQDFKKTFVSSSGAQAMQIGKAQIVSTQEEVIYSG